MVASLCTCHLSPMYILLTTCSLSFPPSVRRAPCVFRCAARRLHPARLVVLGVHLCWLPGLWRQLPYSRCSLRFTRRTTLAFLSSADARRCSSVHVSGRALLLMSPRLQFCVLSVVYSVVWELYALVSASPFFLCTAPISFSLLFLQFTMLCGRPLFAVFSFFLSFLVHCTVLHTAF